MVRKLNFSESLKSSAGVQRFFISMLLVVVVATMSVGYALYHEELSMGGLIILEAPLEIRIYDAEVSSSTSATDKGSTMTFEETNDGMKLVVDTTVHFDAANWGAARPTITYTYRVVNLSHHAYTFSEMTYNSRITNGTANIGDPVITGITKGQVLEPGEELTFSASVTMGAILGISYEKDAIIHIELIFKEGKASVNIGSVQSSLSANQLMIEDNNMAEVDVSLLNVYGYGIDYTLTSSNPNVLLVDKNGNSTTYSGVLDDGSVAEHKVYLKIKDGVDISDAIETTLKVSLTNGTEFIIGDVELSLDPEPKWKDATVTYKINKNVVAFDEYEITFAVNNNSGNEMDEFTAYLYLDDELQFTSIENTDASIVYIPDKHLIKLSSNIKGTSDHNKIGANSSFEYPTIKVIMNQTDLMITDKVIFKEGEIFSDNYSYTTATE